MQRTEGGGFTPNGTGTNGTDDMRRELTEAFDARLRDLVAQARLTERDAVVAWLRGQAEEMKEGRYPGPSGSVLWLVGKLEEGAHRAQ